MKTEDWKPDYSITKGYPYMVPISRERFCVRPMLVLNKDNRVAIVADEKCYPDFVWPSDDKFDDTHNWLTNRLFDFQEALNAAENQIEDMMRDYPFIPEDFGFKKIFGPKTISDNPTTIYLSRYDENISIHRMKDDVWNLLKKNPGGEGFLTLELKFPCHRIAYATFHALQIKVEEKQKNDSDMKKWTATYLPDNNPEKEIKLERYSAIDEDDAKTKASFMITTMIDDTIVVDPQFLKVHEG